MFLAPQNLPRLRLNRVVGQMGPGPRRKSRPGVERLEDYVLLAPFTITSTAYSGTGAGDFTGSISANVQAGTFPAISMHVNPASAVDGPTVTNLQRFGFHAQPTILVLTFSGPLDASRAQDLANYTLVGPVSGRGSRGGHVFTIGSAVYNPTNYTVVLVPAERPNLHRRFELTVNGRAPTGVAGASGALLDGEDTGHPGSNYVAVFGREILSGSSAAFSPPGLRNLSRQSISPGPVDTL